MYGEFRLMEHPSHLRANSPYALIRIMQCDFRERNLAFLLPYNSALLLVLDLMSQIFLSLYLSLLLTISNKAQKVSLHPFWISRAQSKGQSCLLSTHKACFCTEPLFPLMKGTVQNPFRIQSAT